ncbi:MAG: hypothetical protein AB8G17_04350 [Gammaproteobacteria bacterium]
MLRKNRSLMKAAACLAVLCTASASHAQTSFALGGIQSDSGHSVAFDADDNIFLTGIARQAVDFDPSPGVAELNFGGSNVFFVASYTSTGALRYVVPIPGISTTLPETGLAVDGAGNVYVSGSFSGVVDFDPGAGEELLNSANGRLFLASYDTAGGLRFAFNIGFGPPWYEAGKGLYADDDGNLWLTGTFSGTTDFDPTESEFFLQSNGTSDVFVAGYTSTGGFRFAVAVGGVLVDRGLDIAVDSAGNSYVTGAFRDTVDFDPSAGTVELTANETNEDFFLASYTDGGGFRYAVAAGGSNTDIGWGVDVDASGNAFVTGSFSGTADFDPSPGILELTSEGVNNDAFIASYDPGGALRFAFGLGGPNPDEGRALSVDQSGNIVVTGSFRNGFDFDPGPDDFTLNTLAPDSFLASYTNTGAFLSADIFLPLTSSAVTVNEIALMQNDTPALVGTFSGPAGVDLDLGGTDLSTPSNGANDLFFTSRTTDADTDGDGVSDDNDNCTLLPNADQRNTNGDRFGNVCDPDLNNDGIVNIVDLGALRAVFFTADADADFNGDGAVNVVDLGVLRSFFFAPPGPSGLQAPTP